MLSKTLAVFLAALVIASGATYGLAYLTYQAQLDGYREQVSGLEARLSEADGRIDALEEEAERCGELETDYRMLADRWDGLAETAERLNTDGEFLKKRLNQITVTTYTFDDELTLWQDLIPEAERFDPELLPMIDDLLIDYREHFRWVDDIQSRGEMTPLEAATELKRGYDLVWLIIDDLREFDAYWIERVERDIGEIVGPLQE